MLLCIKMSYGKFRLRTKLLLFISILQLSVFGQFERFKSFDISEGICHPFIYTINQDKDGFIWFGTGEGLCRFDGFSFEAFTTLDSLSNDVVNTSFKDSTDVLWFGFNNGLLLSWNGKKPTAYSLPIESAYSITSISQAPWGDIFVTTQRNGGYLINPEGKIRLASDVFLKKYISSSAFASGKLVLGTMDGLEVISLAQDKFNTENLKKPSELEYVNIQVVKKTPWKDIFLVGTEDEGLFLLKLEADTLNLIRVGENTELANQNIQDVLLTEDNTLWVCTYYSGILKLSEFTPDGTFETLSVYKKDSGFSTDFTKTLFEDREGNIWVGTYKLGVALLAEKAFSFLTFPGKLMDNNVLAVTNKDSILWLGGEKGILQVNLADQSENKFYDKSSGLPDDNITSLYYQDGITWIGTKANGIYQLDTKTGRISLFYKTGNSLGNTINFLRADNSSLYAATKDGIFNFDLTSDKKYQYNTEEGLPHNDIEHLFLDSDNKLLFATRSNGIYEINHRGEVEEYFTVGQYELEFNSITQDVNRDLWVSTFGQGIFLLLADTVINITVNDNLKSNYCYSISTADSNYVWVGHRLGLSRINIYDYSIKTFDIDIGIEGDCNPNAVSVSNNGKLYFGTTDGLIQYDVRKGGKKSVPPKTNILRVLISDVEYDISKPIVLPYSTYKLKVEFVGLNYNDPDAVQYQYKLEGYDPDWSDISDLRSASYSRIEDGEYKFYVRAYGADMNFEKKLTGFTLKIKPPIWKMWWFIVSMIVLAILLVVTIIKLRERRQKEIQEYLEKRLDERTREVVEQKEEIEIKNRDITDSINYAQRIQTSILPPIKKLQQSFSGSFIFYQPRDIVSGDFYWFDKVAEGRFVIVCADSTGHGVPGAFMSMIGTTLIKDICISQKANSPADILKSLDSQLTSTLHQNSDGVKSNDGMDIMVCEINTNTNFLRYASAMRPMIVYRNSEQIYIKGSRNSIGGQYDGKDEKEFENHEVQLNTGDLIYMFSDGYPDQFGGPLGKKFKMVRLKNLLKDIHKKPMEEQYEYVKSTFNLWKEDYEQVDDVLFMGIKL